MSKGKKGKAQGKTEGKAEKGRGTGTPSTDQWRRAFLGVGDPREKCPNGCPDLYGAISKALTRLRTEVSDVGRKIDTLAASNPAMAWCKVHKTYEPGVHYEGGEQPAKAPGAETSLPLAGLLFNILNNKAK
jgi:hypothetical protein